MKNNVKGIKNILIFFVAFCLLFLSIVQVSANPMLLNDTIRLGGERDNNTSTYSRGLQWTSIS